MNSFNYRFVIKTMGFLLIIESLFMMAATVMSFYYHESVGDSMLLSSSITIFFGVFLRLIGTSDYERPIGKRESFFLVSITWIILSAFGMLPFYLSGAIPDITNAYFETMSGFTTTGASILTDIDNMPQGLLLWRSITQWIGGIGIVVFALAILPFIGGNAPFLFDAEASGIADDRFQPRINKVAKRLCLIYIVLTASMCLLMWAGPMNFFDALCHSLATLSTGGYSTKQAGISFWNSPYLEYVACFFMVCGGVNFALFYYAFKGSFKKMLNNEELHWYLGLMIFFVVIVTIYLLSIGVFNNIEEAFRNSLFQIASASTSTGFTAPNYMSWGPFFYFVMCFCMFFCACVGSTSGGAKIVRLVVVVKNAINEFKRQAHPSAVLPVRLNGSVVPTEVISKILVFLSIYVMILVISFFILSLSGMGFEASAGAAISCMGNVGPGLGDLGTKGHFNDIPAFSKWYLCFVMMTGRLELFTVISLFIPAFWKK